MNSAIRFIENKTFDEIEIGQSAELARTLKREDIELFAVMSGDVNPAHVDEEFAQSDLFHKVIAHGMWGGALISAVLGTELPGPGAIYLNQSLNFRRPVGLGDTVTVRVTVREKKVEKKRLVLDCECINQAGETVIKGEAEVLAPTDKVRRPRAVLPEVHLHERGARYRTLLESTRDHAPLRTAVVHPCDALSLTGALEAAKRGILTPVLVGPRHRVAATAEDAAIDLGDIEIVDVPHSHAAAETAVALAREARVEALMKGSLQRDELMAAVTDPATGLKTERRMSHVYGLDVPHYPKPLFVTDAAINIFPDLNDKRDIVQNAIDLVRSLGVTEPRVALLSALETVTPKIPSTVDAAALCKMANRGQITGGLVDGPFAFDSAISRSAADTKEIVSDVAGSADILVAPDLEAGNIIAKQLVHLAGADAAGIILGARVPIMAPSQTDDILCALASAALAQLFARYRVFPTS